LNEVDQQHLRRFTTVNVARTPALQPLVPPLPPCDLPSNDALSALVEVRKRLDAIGPAPCALNLTRAAVRYIGGARDLSGPGARDDVATRSTTARRGPPLRCRSNRRDAVVTAPVDAMLVVPDGDAGMAAANSAAPVLRVSVIGGATFEYGGREIGLRNRRRGRCWPISR
jgi:hypothetical protein